MNEEKEQLSPVSVLECPFENDEDDDEDDAMTGPISHQNGNFINRILVNVEQVDIHYKKNVIL